MKIFINIVTAIVFVFGMCLLILAWKAGGLAGTFKFLYLLLLLPCACWVLVWTGRFLFWLLAVALAGFYIAVETMLIQFKKILIRR